MDIKTIVAIALAVINFVIGAIATIKNKKTNDGIKEQNDLKMLENEMRKETIPLMEQAERMLDNGEERENWVIKKLGDLLHIDFYAYPHILKIAKDIIKDICETTKIDVNKVRIIKDDEDLENNKEGYKTNGIS